MSFAGICLRKLTIMIKAVALSLLGAMAFTTAAQVYPPRSSREIPAAASIVHNAVPTDRRRQVETLSITFTPLTSTAVARYAGFGMAYHMALVYTDAAGTSYGASSGPSDLQSPQTTANALNAVISMAADVPSSFGTLIADPHNDTAFTEGSSTDYYTKDREGHAYPRTVVLKGTDLSSRWTSILRTYAEVGAVGLSYAPMSQNSNSLAATALNRAGVALPFSHDTLFTPGTFTILP